MMRILVLLLLTILSIHQCCALTIQQQHQQQSSLCTRKAFFQTVAFGLTAAAAALPAACGAAVATLSDQQLGAIVTSDLVDRQFLVTGNLTRSIYEPTATFTDEIDTYKMDPWMKGTQKLFVGEQSNVRLIGAVHVDAETVTFRFEEDLMFRIPLLHPKVFLSGKIVLQRNPTTGLVSSYREYWDQDVATVLRTAKFNF